MADLHRHAEHDLLGCAEQSFRFNQRKGDDASRFRAVMQNVVGRKLTYAALTKKDEVFAAA